MANNKRRHISRPSTNSDIAGTLQPPALLDRRWRLPASARTSRRQARQIAGLQEQDSIYTALGYTHRILTMLCLVTRVSMADLSRFGSCLAQCRHPVRGHSTKTIGCPTDGTTGMGSGPPPGCAQLHNSKRTKTPCITASPAEPYMFLAVLPRFARAACALQ